MKTHILGVLCSLLALYGCNGVTTSNQAPHRNEIGQYQKTELHTFLSEPVFTSFPLP